MSMEPRCGMNLVRRGRYLRTLMILAALLVSVLLGTLIGPLLPLQAAFIEGGGGPGRRRRS